MRRGQLRCGDAGVTLVEVLTTMTVMGILSGIATVSFARWSVSTAHRGARDQVVSLLRTTAERALSEGRTYCVHFRGDAMWDVYRVACSPSGVRVEEAGSAEDPSETLTPSFAAPSGASDACPTSRADCVYFYPRGNASEGTVGVARRGQPTFVVEVRGLTGRVFAR